jgi:dipeptidyl aminopeptidase/acylaminoacyl peptidase
VKGKYLSKLCGVLALFLMLTLSLTPAQAAILPIFPQNPPIKLVADDEYNKITGLYSFASMQFISPISPDDNNIVAVATLARSQSALVVVNPKTGAVRPLSAQIVRNPLIVAITERVWRDDTTLAYLSLDDKRNPVYVTLDVNSGEIKSQALRLPGAPLSLSPNGKRLMVVLPPAIASQLNTGENIADVGANVNTPDYDTFIKNYFTDIPKEEFVPDWKQHSPYDKSLFAVEDDIIRLANVPLAVAGLDLEAGTVASAFRIPAYTSFIASSWAKDSSKFGWARYIIPTVGRSGNRLNEITTRDAQGYLPPAENPFLQGNVIDTLDFNAKKGTPEFLKATATGDLFVGLNWSPDGQTLATTVHPPIRYADRPHPSYNFQFSERSLLRFYNANGQVIGTHDNPVVNAPNTSVRMISNDEMIVQTVNRTDLTLYYLNRVSGEFRRLVTPPGTIVFFEPTNNTRQIVFIHSSFANPPEIFRINMDGSGFSQLTQINAQAAERGKVKTTEISFTLSNGQQRTGYLIQPRDAAFPPINTPVIMWQEGGPYNEYLNRFSMSVEAPFNFLPQFGYSILFVALPGRSGYGPEFLRAMSLNNNFGQLDIDEGAEISRQMISRGWTSTPRLGLSGCSYGGYFTTQSLVRHPTLYSAGVTQCTLLDWVYEWQFGFTAFVSFLEGGKTSTEIPDEYIKDSPLYGASNIKAATLMFHGTNDFLPIRITTNFHDQVQRTGAATNLYTFDREGHGLSFISSQISASQFQLLWFRQYLK